MVSAQTITGKIGKDLLDIVWNEGGDPEQIVEARGLKRVTDTAAIEKAVDAVIAANPGKVEEVKAKPKLAAWFVGQVMKQTGGKANPSVINALLKTRLGLPDEG
jgi:aspartyl-tRNA(Asn)/glutamyl-tRNA(Gln) amidotransferase subunit B